MDPKATLFLPLRGKRTGAGIFAGAYARAAGITVEGLGVHGLRATDAANALEHEADIAKLQQWHGWCQYQHHPPLRPPQHPAEFKVRY
ncbi:hypothetical protein GCM10027398_00600 [Azotobacter salinestris]